LEIIENPRLVPTFEKKNPLESIETFLSKQYVFSYEGKEIYRLSNLRKPIIRTNKRIQIAVVAKDILGLSG
jgi:hypothetical protein